MRDIYQKIKYYGIIAQYTYCKHESGILSSIRRLSDPISRFSFETKNYLMIFLTKNIINGCFLFFVSCCIVL